MDEANTFVIKARVNLSALFLTWRSRRQYFEQ